MHEIVGIFYEIKPQHIDFNLTIINKDNNKHPIA
jgi:hypothetical protein